MKTLRIMSGDARMRLVIWIVACSSLAYLYLFTRPVHAEASPAAANEDVYQTLKSGERIERNDRYVTPAKPTVYLTFDDGPSQHTAEVLDILQKERVSATFFALGSMAEKHPDIIKRIVNEGHGLGNHTYNHEYEQLYSDFNNFWGQIRKTENILHDIAGIRPAIVRAPGGTYTNFDAFYDYYMKKAGYTVYDWNVDSGDARRKNVPAKQIAANVKKSPLRHELIVLMHDGAGHGETVKALPEIIRYFKSKGYAFAPITDKVKPVRFVLGPTKWTRKTSYASFSGMLAHMERDKAAANRDKAAEKPLNAGGQMKRPAGHENRLAVGQVAGPAGRAVRPDSGKEAHTAMQKPSGDSRQTKSAPKAVSVNGSGPDADKGKPGVRVEKGYVSLRLLAEQMGGQVAWDGKRKMATIRYGSSIAQYFPEQQTIRFHSVTKEVTIRHAEMSLKNGKIIVPLQETLDLLRSGGGNLAAAERLAFGSLEPAIRADTLRAKV